MNRAQRREAHRALKRLLKEATRDRDREASRLGVGTPPESIKSAIRRSLGR